MSNEIKRATGYLVIEVVNSNPNGDRTVKAIPVSARTAAGKFPGVLQAQTARSSGRSRYAVFRMLPEKFQENGVRYWIAESRKNKIDQLTKEMGDPSKDFLDSIFCE